MKKELTAAELEKRRTRRSRFYLLSPSMLTIGIFGIVPLCLILVYSFLAQGRFIGVEWVFDPDAYVRFLFDRDIFDGSLSFNPAYLEIFLNSIYIALLATFFTLLIGFPTAYYISTLSPQKRNLWVFLISIPFWTSILIRTFSIQIIIRDEGLINHTLMTLGVIDSPLNMLYTNFAVILGLIYTFLPFMVLPLYASLARLDFRLIEASYDLYATRWQVLWKIIIPLAKPGIVAGSILVFIPALGSYIAPLLLGGSRNFMVSTLIEQQFGASRNWPFGSAISIILMTLVMISLIIYVRNLQKEDAENA